MEDSKNKKYQEWLKNLKGEEKEFVEKYASERYVEGLRHDMENPEECPECSKEMMQEWICHYCGFPDC